MVDIGVPDEIMKGIQTSLFEEGENTMCKSIFEKVISNGFNLCTKEEVKDKNVCISNYIYDKYNEESKDEEVLLEFMGDTYSFEDGKEYYCAIADDTDLERTFELLNISSSKTVKIDDVVFMATLVDNTTQKEYTVEMYDIPNRHSDDLPNEGWLDFNTLKIVS